MTEEPVTTILEIDASDAVRGGAQYAEVMDKAAAASNKLTEASSLLIAGMSKSDQAMLQAKSGADRSGLSLVDVAASVYLVKSAYDALIATTGVVGSVFDSVFKGIYAAIAYVPNKIGEIWQEGIDKLDSYIKLSQDAGKHSVEFYQRIVKGAELAKVPVEELLKMLDSVDKALSRTLGTNGLQNGSAFNTQITEFQKNGNLAGQRADINRLNNAVTSPEQMQAAIKLINDATNAGYKLVGLDLTKTLFGDTARENLSKDNFYLEGIRLAAEKVKADDLIKQPDVDRAVGMKLALEAAYKVLDDRNKTVKSDWSGWGIEIQQVWVNVVTQYVSALTWLDKILGRTNDIAKATQDIKPSFWTGVADHFTSGMSPEAIKAMYGVSPISDAERSYDLAKNQLGSKLQNPRNTQNNIAELQKADDWITRDLSKPPPEKAVKQKIDADDKVDSAINSLRRHTEQQIADTTAVQVGFNALARIKAAAEQAARTAQNDNDKQRVAA